jgi:predicted Zn-dependent protease
VQGEWFRDPAWDQAARDEFERRLSRARAGNRPQYLRIKALALRGARHLAGAKQLLYRVVSDYPESLDCRFCLELLGDIAREEGSAQIAERNYREVIRRWPDLNATSGMVEVSLAELLAESNRRDGDDEALRLLDSALKRGRMLNSNLFRWNVALARVAERIGDSETVTRAARTALSLTERGPQFPRHSRVGLVAAEPATLVWLEKAAKLS